ncbi:MAG: biopolymer transporter ExbD [Myxococcales bacterium]|nr:biopolymer transporter ExbD [Myxococcales bacterium]
MHSSRRTLELLIISCCLAVAVLGCDKLKGGGEEEGAPGASPENEMGRPLADLELPVSLRTSDPAPSNPYKVESTTEQLRLDGEPVANLDKGFVDEKEQQNGIITKLAEKMRSPSRSSVALRLQANMPYETVALILNTAKQAGARDAAIQVRKTGAATDSNTGWLNASGYLMSSKADDVPAFTATKVRGWNDFTDNWQSIYEGCRTAASRSCAYVNENFATGGTLRQELMSSGRGININFFRRGLTPEQEAEEEIKRAAHLAAKKEDFLQGRITEEEMIEVLMLGDPSTYALFQFRYQEALKSPSALTQTMASMCHGERCGIVVTADKISPLLRVVSMMGAAFPDGTPSPEYAFEMSWTERPKPKELAEFIERQMQLSAH